MISPISIRPYAPDDWPRLCAIHDAARLDELKLSAGEAAFLTLEQTAEGAGLFTGRLDVAVRDGRVEGFVAFDDHELRWLYVDPAAYRGGIGRVLLRHAVAHAGPSLRAEVLEGNDPALALYRTEGFRVLRRVEGRLEGNDSFPAVGFVLVRDRDVPKAAPLETVIDVMCDAFRDYPVMRFVLGAVDGPDDLRFRKLIGLFVRARELRGEPMLALYEGDRAVAAATVTLPGKRQPPEAFVELRERVWDELGPEPRARYEAFATSGEAFYPEEPHHHLNMLGVRRSHAGKGLARPLLEAVHALADADPASGGVTLSTEDAKNIALYEHFGYVVRGHVKVGEGLESWVFYREKS